MENKTLMITNNSFTIRPIWLDELNDVLEVYRQCEDFLALGPVPRASLEMIEKDMQISKEAGGIFCGIFDKDNHMIGILDFIPRNFEGNPDHAFIELLMIATPARRKGLGMEVVRSVEQEISRDAEVKYILATVQVNNPSAISFWTRVGYQIVSEPIVNEDGTTVYILCKELQKEKL